MKVLFLLLFLLMPQTVLALDVLRGEGIVMLMRHATAPGTDDPPGFRPDDCATQRNLNDVGRQQATDWGTRLREAGITVDVIASSGWCRARETAELMAMGPVLRWTSLDSFYGERGRKKPATDETLARLKGLRQLRVLLVTHQVNIFALTGVAPSSGEIVVARMTEDGKLQVLDRLPSP